MIGLLAAAALAVSSGYQADVTARDIGRLSFFAGVCSTLGWESSYDRAVAGAEAWKQAHPGTIEADNVAQIELGIADARGELDALVLALRSDQNATAFASTLKTRCDDAARDFPEVVNRAADTDSKFTAAMTRIVQGNVAR